MITLGIGLIRIIPFLELVEERIKFITLNPKECGVFILD
jgi:hypothetical protein